MIETKHVDAMLFSLLGSHKLVKDWWNSPNKAFNMRHPIDVWDNDEDGPTRIYDYLCFFCYR
jgi:uncharacterized protein (DUF2384 family)